MATEIHEETREVTVSSNRQVGLVSAFARRMGVEPQSKVLETLVRLPGGAYAVIIMRKPTSHVAMFLDAITPTGRGGVTFLRKLRDEEGARAPKRGRKV